MSKFRRNSIIVIALEVVLIIVFNIVLAVSFSNNVDRQYRVDIFRIKQSLLEGETINVDEYDSIIKVEHFDENYKTNNDYAVVDCNGTLYSIEYRADKENFSQLYMNIAMGSVLLVTVAVLIYVDLKILKPFNKLSNYSTELAKGNLNEPLKEEKNKNFGKFVWGMDMLRDTLETNKKKELKLQKEKKTLILSISHDIKTPLSAINLYTKALKEGVYDTDEKKLEALDGIEKNSKQIENYVSEIVTASREDFLNLSVTIGEAYLSDILRKIESLYKEKFENIHTEFSVDSFTNCLLKCDEDRLVEVIQNVLENTIKYGDGKYVKIEISEEEDYKLITVINSGNTLKEDELPHLFDSFYRGSNVNNAEGSGLGLYIAKTLMHMMKGDIFAKINKDEFMVSVVVKQC